MKTLLLYLFPLLLMLGGALFGWLARWYKYGGRCGKGGIADGVPNIDARSGTVKLDGSEPAVAMQERKAGATASGRSALDSLKAGYFEGKVSGATPETSASGSSMAKVGAAVGGVAATVGAGIASASSSVRGAANTATDKAKSGLASIKGGSSESKVGGATPESPASGSTMAKVGAAVGGAAATVGAGIASASSSVRDVANTATDKAKSGLASIKDGSSESKVSGEPAGGPATTTSGGAASGTAPSAKDAGPGGVASGKSTEASISGGSAAEKTSDAPKDASSVAKSTAPYTAGGAGASATPTSGGTASGTVPSAKDVGPGGVASGKSTEASISGGSAAEKTGDVTKDASSAARSTAPYTAGGAGTSATTTSGGAASGTAPSAKDAGPGVTGTTKPKTASVEGGAASAGGITGDGTASKKEIDPADGGKTSTDAKGASFKDASGDANTNKASAVRDSSPDAGSRTSAGNIGAAVAVAGAAGVGAVSANTGQATASDHTLPGATIGQEDGHIASADENISSSGAVGMNATLSSSEREALRLLEGDGELSRPSVALMSPRVDHTPDDLTKINGIGKATQRTLNDEGIYYYDQIAEFDAQDVAWADRKIDGDGRVVSDRWVPQARDLAASGNAGSSMSADVDDSADGGAVESEVDVPDTLSAEEQEAQRLIDSGAEVSKPATALAAPRAGRSPDDLKRIKGIGPKIETTLNGEGIYYYDQIAEFGGRDIAWADKTLAIKGRVVRDRWVPQAKGLASLGSGGADAGTGGAMRSRFASLSDEAESDVAAGSGMDAGMIDIPDSLSADEIEANRLIESGETIGKPQNTLAKPEEGRAVDDLKLISGIGPKIEGMLNDEGVYYFDQIANFGARDLAWADQTLGFKGRVVRDRWVPQARGLVAHRDRIGLGATVGKPSAGASGGSIANMPLSAAEAEALRLIERDGGYAATSQNRPEALVRDGPVSGKPDDLKRIKGIGEKLETVLNKMGVYYFHQIANLSANDIAWVDSKLNFKGRVIRDRWIPQAENFAKNGNA